MCRGKELEMKKGGEERKKEERKSEKAVNVTYHELPYNDGEEGRSLSMALVHPGH